MKTEEFEQVWSDQIALEKSILLDRAAAYASKGDRLGNFKDGANLAGVSPLQYGFGLVVKHVIALRDLIDKEARGECTYSEAELAKFKEYVTDTRNYAVLFEAIYIERKQCNELGCPR